MLKWVLIAAAAYLVLSRRGTAAGVPQPLGPLEVPPSYRSQVIPDYPVDRAMLRPSTDPRTGNPVETDYPGGQLKVLA